MRLHLPLLSPVLVVPLPMRDRPETGLGTQSRTGSATDAFAFFVTYDGLTWSTTVSPFVAYSTMDGAFARGSTCWNQINFT